MGEWGWVIVGYVAMIGALVGYVGWLRFRLNRAAARLEEGRG